MVGEGGPPLRRLRDRGLISRRRPWPIHVAYLMNVSDRDIVNWSTSITISPLSYYRCCDNLYQVRTIVDYQICWSAIFTLAYKHKSSTRNIILKYSKDSNIVNPKGGKTFVEFPNSIKLFKLGPARSNTTTVYFKNPLAYKGLLSSDEVLVTQSQASLELVKKYAYNGDLFFEQFAKSAVKLANLSPPLRGPRGEFQKH
ncbi:hypothetical protein SAY87_016518 [Trapa incisa]|uniref:Plant heme peroxidase family profile domain-containing protein n=1 Tax=Trapa incisa TaxID=236973 RepID=A0AAN7LHL2_9MYRT|nr:hypothetical protein SAY87_016518 [Trapa incisa]